MCVQVGRACAIRAMRLGSSNSQTLFFTTMYKVVYEDLYSDCACGGDERMV